MFPGVSKQLRPIVNEMWDGCASRRMFPQIAKCNLLLDEQVHSEGTRSGLHVCVTAWVPRLLF